MTPRGPAMHVPTPVVRAGAPVARLRPRQAGDRGITLLELVAVLAVLSLVSVLGVQTLTGSLRARDRVSAADAVNAAHARMLHLMREDLRSFVDLPFVTVQGISMPSIGFDDGGERLTFSTAGRGALPSGPASGLARVSWRMDRQRGGLVREIWPTLTPGSPASPLPEAMMLAGASDLGLRSFVPGAGWIAGLPDPTARDAVWPPPMVEITLTSREFGRLRLVEALR